MDAIKRILSVLATLTRTSGIDWKALAKSTLAKAAAVASRLAEVLTARRAAVGMLASGLMLVFDARFTPAALFAARCVFLACATAYAMHRLKGDGA